MRRQAVLAIALAALSVGCLGRGGLNGRVKEFNLETVENRYAREGIFLGLQVLWVYRVCSVLDLFVFNSIEFWSHDNPINGKTALADLPASEVEKIGFREIDGARFALVSADAATLQLDFTNGDRMTFDVQRHDTEYTVSYQGRVFYHGRVGPVGSAQP
jgi:hypothetical protein